jgi:hypothetical protein
MRREAGRDASRRVLALLAALITVAAAGCASVRPMALGGSAAPALNGASLVLLTIRVSNQFRPAYPPDAKYILIGTAGTPREILSFRLDAAYRQGANGVNEYLVSLELPPGSYRLREVFGSSGRFPIRGVFVVTVFLPFTVEPNTVTYLGRLEATVRERTSEREYRAGPPVPIIDQAVTGFAEGTFDVRIADGYAEDLAAFHARYPALAAHAVRKALLPPWTSPAPEELD